MAVQHFYLLNWNQRRVASRRVNVRMGFIQEFEIEKCIREAE